MTEPQVQLNNPYARPPEAVLEPPTGFWRKLRFLGPSFILMGSIVGSGELILTTSLGAKVGFAALWFIILSCVCKTILQTELGRYTISSGDTCLEAFNRLPGPRYRVSWLVWLWVLWQIPGLINGGAILGSTGQVLAVAFPVLRQEAWALVIALANVAILLRGRYAMLESVSTFMVISFSVITVLGAIALQLTPQAAPWGVALAGLQVQLGPLIAPAALATVISAFAATGVSGGELMGYTYWCVEKGYARYTGVADGSEAWTRRAWGWIRVMQLDVWLATAIFTASTVAFFWLGAGILHRRGLDPGNSEMIRTIQNIYTGSLGPWASVLFLVGAFFVLYTTIFSGTAGTSRMYADALGVFKLVSFEDFPRRMKWIRIFTVAVPLVQTAAFAAKAEPHVLLIFGAVANGLLLPIIAGATIWLRYHGTDPRIAPGRLSDAWMWLCGLLVASVSGVFLALKAPEVLALFGGGGR